jgi:hypothetical protein
MFIVSHIVIYMFQETPTEAHVTSNYGWKNSVCVRVLHSVLSIIQGKGGDSGCMEKGEAWIIQNIFFIEPQTKT